MADLFNIAGRIHSTSQEEVVTTTNEILDATQEKKQSEVNQEVSEELALHTNRLNALTGQNYVTVVATQSTTAADIPTLINATGEGEQTDTLYRVGFWDGSAYVADKYTEYAWNGTAYVILDVKSSIGEVFDISQYNAVGGTLTPYADLAAALGVDGANVPSSVRRGGMSIKFVQSSDNKYMQFRLMATTWSTNVGDWQGVEGEPTPGSQNIITSDGASKPQTNFRKADLTIYSQPNSRKITADGIVAVDDNYKLIKYDVVAGTTLYLDLSKDGEAVYQFQSSSAIPTTTPNPYIIGKTVCNAAKGLVKVPEGAIYLFVSQLISNNTNIANLVYNDVVDTPSKNDKNPITSGAVFDLVDSEDLFVSGEYIAKTGSFGTNDDCSRSILIPVVEGKEYNIRAYFSSTISAVYAYDIDGSPLGEVQVTETSGNYTGILNVDSDILTDYPKAKYWAISCKNNFNPSITLLSNREPVKGINYNLEAIKSLLKTTSFVDINAIEGVSSTYSLSSAIALVAKKYRDRAKGISFRHTDGTVHIAVFNHTSYNNDDVWGNTENWTDITDIIKQLGINVSELLTYKSWSSEVIGKNDESKNYTSSDFSNVSYQSANHRFVNSGPSTNGIIIPVETGISYKSTLNLYLCSEIPANGKTDSIIVRNIGANTLFTAEETESYAFISINTSSFTSLTFTIFGYGLQKKVSILESNVSSLNTEVGNLETRVDELESGEKDKILLDAAEYDAVNTYRERQLRQEYWNKVNNEQYVGKWYGVEWSETDNPDNVTAINSTGDSNLHTTLPIQNKMRRCVTKDNVVQYYLDANNSELKADGTDANLDGTDGNVMVEIPEFFYKIEEEIVSDVRTIRMKISEDALPDFIFSPKRYTSAYEVTINRTTGFLASVCTTLFTRDSSEEVKTETGSYIQGNDNSRGIQQTARRNGHTANAATFRGGTNDASLDQYENPSETNYARNQLGIPVANINRIGIREACDEHQFGYLYDTQRILYMLIQTEYKTRNIQKSIATGGLGVGATRYPSYEAYESFFKPQRGISCLPCGITNCLGNHSGEVFFLMQNVPVSQSGTGDEITYTFGNVWMPCMSYRGVEHYFGHIYKIADQVDCQMSGNTGYVPGHDGEAAWALRNVTYWYEKNPYLAKLGISNKQENLLGTWNFPCNIKTVSSLMMGKYGHVLHINASGTDYNKYYCDCSEINNNAGLKKYITFNGRIVSGSLVGNHFLVSVNTIDGEDARPSDGTRLDHF